MESPIWKLKKRKRMNGMMGRKNEKRRFFYALFGKMPVCIRELHVLGRRLNGKDKSKTRCTKAKKAN